MLNHAWKSLSLLLGVLAVGQAAMAQEIYRWVDEYGVVNFSHTPPGSDLADVNTLSPADLIQTDFGAGEDVYDLERQAERIQARRAALEERRDEARERRQSPPATPVVQYRIPPYYGGYWPLRPHRLPRPLLHRSRLKPSPPLIEPERTTTLKPLD